MSKHWSDEDLIHELYGIGPEDGHLEDCGQCRARWLQLRERRDRMVADREIPVAFLTAQRQRIYDRIESGHASWSWRITPVLAALSVVLLGVVLSRPAPPPQPTLAVNSNTDSGFYTEIYSMIESPEPWAAEPINGLFED